MADKAISELVSAEQITATDMFVLEQNGTAKKLTGQVLLNWLTAAADGHGGIQSWEPLKKEELVTTYRVTLADQTFIDIDVVDGRGIESVKPTSTNGLVVTYTITYNDGKTDTFTVTNGAKGDPGVKANVWIRYASQKPTASSHSFGEVADAWIGICSNHQDTAPTDWQEYTWYQWKGEKGDTGAPATLVSSEIRYQVGDSGIIIPSGSWSENIPPVTPGKYLWTRKVIQFNTGAPITSYSVSRFGIDGTGAVSTVSGVAPDENGNVHLDAASVKAMDLSGGTMEGSINMNGQRLYGLNEPTEDSEAVSKGYVDTNKVDKSKVVNGFDTSEEGFVADARTLKVLNESKLSMELLWENESATSDFAERTIQIDLSGYDGYLVEFTYSTYSSVKFTRPVLGFCTISVQLISGVNSQAAMGVRGRECTLSENEVIFKDCYSHNMNATDNTVANQYMIPTRIYGIKGVS